METFGIETDGCPLCAGPAGDAKLKRVLVWEDRLWRLTMSPHSEIPGLSYLEPKCHIPYVMDLDGEEVRTLGVVLARTTRVLRGRPARTSSSSMSSADVSRMSISISPRM